MRAGKLAPEGEAAPQGEAEGEPGKLRKKLAAAGGFLLDKGEAVRGLAAAGALLLSRRGEEIALSALQSRRVCAAGAGGEGRGGGDNTQVTG